MKIVKTEIPGVIILEPKVFQDDRGFFMETYQKQKYAEAGITTTFVQDNYSFSQKNTLRGLHYQYPHAQAKLVQVLQGSVLDIAVDIRRGSPTFGKWISIELTENNNKQFFIPAGFAHGFVVLSETATFTYKCSDFYSPADEKGILFSDSELDIDWPQEKFILSEKDREYPCLRLIPPEHLPEYA
jgi:dTDP-4-dehydrorhamnose 3,5-epimerase